jgi:hypothetical protein
MVFLKRVGEDQYVVEIYRDDAFCDQILKNLIHYHLEGGRTIGEAEVHD